MPAQTDLDLTLHEAALKCDEARNAARRASRLRIPVHHRGLINSAVRHLDVAAEEMFKVAQLPRDRPAPKARQMSMERL